LITANLAIERDIAVMAVPGAAGNRAARGTNGLLRDGMPPVLDVADVLLALSLDHTRTTPAAFDHRIPPRPSDLATYRACVDRPQTIGEVAERHGVDLLAAAMSLARLEQTGWLAQVDGWYEAVGSPLR
jgi:predicted Rossmann fold nucleotide-binding protein DprA/Smf involved in DNA uptake